MTRLRNLLRPLLSPAWQWWVLRNRMRALCARCVGMLDHGLLFDAVSAVPEFAPLQHKVEFLEFMKLIAPVQPSRVCEIGSFKGGTGFLLSRVLPQNAILVLLDLEYGPPRRAALRSMARGNQQVFTLIGDSHRIEMRDEVSRKCGGDLLDVLFIDGDHSYEGVSRDLEIYAPLVRSGGVIAFHDIVPLKSGGDSTTANPGNVPKFWEELKIRFPNRTHEFIRDREQSGCGIGVIHWQK